MKTLIVAFMAILAVAQAAATLDLLKAEWTAFKNQHNKSYTEKDDLLRFKIYMANKDLIAEHNRKYEAGLVTYTLGMNKYGDMRHDEFVRMMNGLKQAVDEPLSSEEKPARRTFIPPANVEFPDQVDWRKSGAVSRVKDQGQCGSCWAFSATGSLEGQHFKKTGIRVSLSEQNLVDCSGPWGNNGCGGGLMDNAFQYIKDNGGINTESVYPYEAEDNKCRFVRNKIGAQDFGFVDIPSHDEQALKAAVATVGPIAIAIDASSYSFQLYSGGVYIEPDCSSDNLDHGVLAVGYGHAQNGGDYWVVKNSWGLDWGIDGYILMARNRSNQCGVATMASYPIV